MSPRPIRILLVEDDPGDVDLLKEAMKREKVAADLSVAADGAAALALLGDKRADGHPPADLILLDLNMPGVDGREVLRVVKSDERLKMIPVVVLTTSSAPGDVVSCYKLGANGYVAKPFGLAELSKAVRAITDFWLSLAKLPTLA